ERSETWPPRAARTEPKKQRSPGWHPGLSLINKMEMSTEMIASSRRVVTRPSSVSSDTMTATPVLVWQRALRSSGLPAATLAVLYVLATYADYDGRNAFPGEARLAAHTGLSPRTVRRHLELARRAGWITRDETSGGRARARGLADRY